MNDLLGGRSERSDDGRELGRRSPRSEDGRESNRNYVRRDQKMVVMMDDRVAVSI
jgi:hypothetical protein